MRPKADKQPA